MLCAQTGLLCRQADLAADRHHAGGGYDAYGRLLARHIGRHIPGNPSVVAKNMPGAGGVALANHLYNRAPKDGTEFATVQNGLPFEKLFHMLSPGGKSALFNSTKFGWIGSVTQTVFVTVTWHTSAAKTLQDAMTRETILGASGTSADSYVLAMLSNNLLGTKFKVVHGYAGATEVDLGGRERRGRGRGRQGLDHAHLHQAAMDQGQADQHHRADGHAAACRYQGRADGDRAGEVARRPPHHGGRVRQVRDVAAVLGAARAAA